MHLVLREKKEKAKKERQKWGSNAGAITHSTVTKSGFFCDAAGSDFSTVGTF